MKTQQTEALQKAQSALRGLSFKDEKITSALESISRALDCSAPQPAEPAQPAGPPDLHVCSRHDFDFVADPKVGCPKCNAEQPATQARVPSLEWAVQGWRDEVQNRPLVNVHRRFLDWMWRKMVKRFGGDPDALLGPDHDVMQGFAPMPLHKASPGPDPTIEQPGDAERLDFLQSTVNAGTPVMIKPYTPVRKEIDAARAAHGKGGQR